jgi:hypothetical protein
MKSHLFYDIKFINVSAMNRHLKLPRLFFFIRARVHLRGVMLGCRGNYGQLPLQPGSPANGDSVLENINVG